MPQTRFNPPPTWPVPQGWTPPPGWEPDPSWPPAPAGWQFFVDEPTPQTAFEEEPALAAEFASAADAPPWAPARAARGDTRWLVVAVVAVVAVAAGVGAFVYHRVNQPDIIVLRPVDALGAVQSGWQVDTSGADRPIDCSYGSPSPYDKTAGVRDCGASADSGDACWPAADSAHVLCLRDPFSNELSLLRAYGLSAPRKPLADDPIPFALLLDDGTQCQARHGGAWPSPKEHPDWVGYYGCRGHDSTTAPTSLDAVWAATGEGNAKSGGIGKGFGGWTVEVGTEDGHLTGHQVTKAYYVGVASPGAPPGGANTPQQGGTRMVTKCGRTPQFQPEAIRSDTGGLVIRMKIVALCPGGDVLGSPQTRISVTSGGQNVASGVFDLSTSPIVIPPGSGGSSSPSVEHDFRFPLGSFWRLPVSTGQAPSSGSPQQGPTDLSVTTLVVACQETGSASSAAPADPAAGSKTSTAAGPAPPPTGDSESASLDALRAIANADRPFVTGQLADRWVPQLSSKRPGLVADGITWDNSATLREHLKLRLQYPEVRLLWTGDWSTFSEPDFWVTVAGVTFPDAGGALAWCRDHSLDREHCYAKLVSTTHPIDGSTAFNP